MTRPKTVVRALAAAGIAATLAGCQTRSASDVVADKPSDYRLRHPIAIREGVRSVEVFIGTNRGSLTPQQRAEVAAIAGTWRREATGGIVIRLPYGTPNEHAASAALREVRA